MQTDESSGVRLWDLRMTSCRWPLGGTWAPAEFFCGEPAIAGCSWCKEHRQRAYARTVWSSAKNPRNPGKVLKDRR